MIINYKDELISKTKRYIPIITSITLFGLAFPAMIATRGFQWVLDTSGSWSFVFTSISIPLFISSLIWLRFGSSSSSSLNS